MTWPAVGRQTARVVREALALGRAGAAARARSRVSLGPLRLDHLLTLVDDVGIIEHADGVLPSRRSGYCVDDVARAGHRRGRAAAHHRRGDLPAHRGPDAGVPALRLGAGGRRHAQPALLRPALAGRAARRRSPRARRLGPRRGAAPPSSRSRCTSPCGCCSPSSCRPWPRSSTRARRPTPCSASRAPRPRRSASAARPCCATSPAACWRATTRRRSDDWPWFLDTLAYDDARLPQALIAAGPLVGDAALLEVGLDALAWFGDRCGLDGEHVVLVGAAARRPDAPLPPVRDEQPLDAAALVEAEVEAFAITGAGPRTRGAPAAPSSGSWARTGSASRSTTSPPAAATTAWAATP